MSKVYKEKKCLLCGNLFIPNSGKHRYCGNIKDFNSCSYKHKSNENKKFSKTYLKIKKDKVYIDRLSYRLKKEYNISIEEYFEMLDKQNNQCAICNLPESSKDFKGSIRKLSVDHCHTTGKVRGLLCFRCNVSIGRFNDDIELLEKAILYLKK